MKNRKTLLFNASCHGVQPRTSPFIVQTSGNWLFLRKECSMGNSSIFERIKEKLRDIIAWSGWHIFLWARNLTQEEYLKEIVRENASIEERQKNNENNHH